MSNVSIKYVFWGRAGKRRHGGTTTIPVPDEMLNTGKAKVLFWSVVGAAGGPIVSFTQAIPSFGVGPEDIYATAFCVLGNGSPQNVAFIDAFDIDTGAFLDDDFVTVYDMKNGPKNQTLSKQANDNGTVPTTNDEEFVFGDIPLPEGAFQYWKIFGGTVFQNGTELDITPASEGSIAFAFYQKKRSAIGRIDVGSLIPIVIGHTSDGIIMLGPNGPIVIHYGGPDPSPELNQILAAAQQHALSTKLSPTLRSEALDLVAKQLISTSKAVRKSAQDRLKKVKD